MTRRRLVKLVSVVQHPQFVKLCRGLRHRHDCIGVTIDNRKDEIFHHGQKPVKLLKHGMAWLLSAEHANDLSQNCNCISFFSTNMTSQQASKPGLASR